MPKCNFNKVAKLQSNFIEIALWYGYSPVNLLHIFRTSFPRNTFGWLLLSNAINLSHIFEVVQVTEAAIRGVL